MAHIGKAKAACAIARRLNPTKVEEDITRMAEAILLVFAEPPWPHPDQGKMALEALLKQLDQCEMPTAAVEVVGYEEKRDLISSTVGPGENLVKELAIGETRSRLFIRGPSKKLYAVQVPGEMIDELYPARAP